MKSIIDARDAKISEQAELIRRLQHNVEVFRRLAFGKSSERRPVQRSHEDPSQGHLFAAQLIEEAELVADCKGSRGHVEQKAAKKKRPGGRRKKFPEHLPVWRTDFGLPSEKMTCSCGSPLHAIGADVRRELERIEICIVHEIACQKYACRSCEKVVMASGPDRVIEKGILGTGFLSSVLVERFGNHMPYHRLEKKYAAEGLDLSRSVLQRSMSKLGELFRPIYDQLGRDVLQSPVIFTDDTPVTVANHSNKKKSGQGRCWIYADREGRHFYDYTASRKRDGPARILGQYRGYIQADAYPGYDQLFLPEGATEVACWAHARRKFVEIESSDKELSAEAIRRIRRLNAIERRLKEQDASDEQRRKTRQEESVPILKALHAWLELQRTSVLPRSAAAGAIAYALNQWEALNRYTEDGRLEIDNNRAERAMRPFAVGRKNWLFFQNDSGGETAVVLASLLRSALAIGVNPLVYFRDLMLRIGKCSDVKKLTPHGWKLHFSEEVDARRSQVLASILKN